MNEFIGPVMDAVDAITQDARQRKAREANIKRQDELYARSRTDRLSDTRVLNALKMFQGSSANREYTPESRKEAFGLGLDMLQYPQQPIPEYSPEFTDPLIDIPDSIVEVLPGLKGQKTTMSELPDISEKAAKARLGKEKLKSLDRYRRKKLHSSKKGSGGKGSDEFKRLDKLENSALKILQSGYQGLERKDPVDSIEVGNYLDNVNTLRAELKKALRSKEGVPEKLKKEIDDLKLYPSVGAEKALKDREEAERQEAIKREQDALLNAARETRNSFSKGWRYFF